MTLNPRQVTQQTLTHSLNLLNFIAFISSENKKAWVQKSTQVSKLLVYFKFRTDNLYEHFDIENICRVFEVSPLRRFVSVFGS